jgi:enoyl-[acyl-carrier protein] reductase II
VNAAETDTVFLNRFSRPALRALRTERTTRLEREDSVSMAEFAHVTDLYFGGDLEASIALGGQVMGRIESVMSVREIIESTMAQFEATLERLHPRNPGES